MNYNCRWSRDGLIEGASWFDILEPIATMMISWKFCDEICQEFICLLKLIEHLFHDSVRSSLVMSTLSFSQAKYVCELNFPWGSEQLNDLIYRQIALEQLSVQFAFFSFFSARRFLQFPHWKSMMSGLCVWGSFGTFVVASLQNKLLLLQRRNIAAKIVVWYFSSLDNWINKAVQ